MEKILIVDDQEVDREFARRCLTELGAFEVAEAREGEEALRRIPEFAPDLVLTDLRMPGMDGLELVEQMRDEYRLIPVILMTSRGNERVAVKALRAGAASYVPKSDLKQDLADTVHRVLDVVRARRERSRILGFLGHCEMRFELESDPGLIYPLSGYFQENLERIGFGTESLRNQIGVSLMEALSNAIIHGNLDVPSSLRRENKAEYDRLLSERVTQKPYRDRRVHCMARENVDRVEYVIQDEGGGFDPSTLPDPRDMENLLHASGRGVLLIRTFMDEVEFNKTGNRITMRKKNPAGATAPAEVS